jgi:death-on-curing protein
MKWLNKTKVILLHGSIIKDTGGADGILDENLIEAALSAPFAEFDGRKNVSDIYR